MRRIHIAAALAVSLLAVGCERAEEPGPTLLSEGPLFDERAWFCFAIYYLPTPGSEPLAALRRELEASFPDFRLVPKLASDLEGACVAGLLEKYVQTEFAPPSVEALRQWGFGVSEEQAKQVQQSREALLLRFVVPRAEVWERGREACRLALALARATGGLLWDEETRECFSPDAWQRRRLAEWESGIPDLSEHITIHVYRTNGYCRAVTLGMVKFALPDVVVNDLSWSNQRSIGHLINVVCQRMAEGQAVGRGGRFPIDLDAVAHPGVRQRRLDGLLEHATREADLVLAEAEPDEGDPDNLLAEIRFDRYQGVNVQARHEALLDALFGWEDDLHPVTHTEAVLEASRRAREKLPELRKAYQAGLAPGEYLMVKAPFKTPDGGNEWMWVEVTGWPGTTLRGILQNRPVDVPDLDAGEEVYVKQADVFDYIRQHPDGRQEGNETGKLFEKQREGEPRADTSQQP